MSKLVEQLDLLTELDRHEETEILGDLAIQAAYEQAEEIDGANGAVSDKAMQDLGNAPRDTDPEDHETIVEEPVYQEPTTNNIEDENRKAFNDEIAVANASSGEEEEEEEEDSPDTVEGTDDVPRRRARIIENPSRERGQNHPNDVPRTPAQARQEAQRGLTDAEIDRRATINHAGAAAVRAANPQLFDKD